MVIHVLNYSKNQIFLYIKLPFNEFSIPNTKLCLECKNYKNDICLKIIRYKNVEFETLCLKKITGDYPLFLILLSSLVFTKIIFM